MHVKQKSHRQRQADATRRQIAAAARALFAQQGYVGTTITAISKAAQIPAQTIYSAMGSKAAILQWIAWDAVGTLDIDRLHEEALADPDPASGLFKAAAIQRSQYETMYDVISVYQEAARTDHQIAAAIATISENRERAFRRHLGAIAAQLRAPLTVDVAAAVYLALVLPEIYRTLVIEQRWTPEEYESWLGLTLNEQLLGHRSVPVRSPHN